jgi:SpoVK/Ycf46/Vps4 family AAA+-type ATPase
LKLDVGSLRSKYVGESEGNIRRALATIEACSPVVVLIDELEKCLAGSTGPQGDGGVAADALGTLLAWMNDHTSTSFIVATSNDVRALPAELLRRGRFDEVWWTDLPTSKEREEVLAAALRQHGREPESIALDRIAELTEGFSGAEIAAIVPDALFTAFAAGERAMTTADLIEAAKTVVPLSRTAGDKIQALREWAKGRARPASTPEVKTATDSGRKLDL